MEQHPIPRQITTFEFKLIGFMTLRQFLYLLVFTLTAYIVYVLFPIPLLNIFLGLCVALVGVALAFVPINDRPMDVWIKNLYKRLTSPTQYTFRKENRPLYFLENLVFLADPHRVVSHVESKEKLAEYLQKTQPRAAPAAKKMQIQSLLQTPTSQIRPPSQKGIVSPVKATAKVQSAPQPPIQVVTQRVPVAPSIQTQISPHPVQPQPSSQVQAQQSPQLQTQSSPSVVTPQPQSQIPVPPPRKAQPIASMPQAAAAPPQLNSVQHPFLTGVVHNNKKIPLPGILVYIKDQNNVPLRLLKTNPHGVFATYNPLPSGEYTFEIKDPNGSYFFDTMKVQVPNANNVPYEFSSKELM